MSDLIVETTNESGVVKQEYVSVSQTELDLRWRSLVRIDGSLERATTLKELYVILERISGVESYAFSSFIFGQLNNNCFVDVPACVLALTRVDFFSVSVLFILFLR
jgi:hypothetical protein